MPIFEYKCKACGKTTEVLVSSAAAKKPACEHCGSKATEKQFSAFAGPPPRKAIAGAAPATPARTRGASKLIPLRRNPAVGWAPPMRPNFAGTRFVDQGRRMGCAHAV